MTAKTNPIGAALVTGSSRGIGLGIALALARQGFSLAINGPEDDDELDQAVTEVKRLGVDVVKLVADVSAVGAHSSLLEHAESVIGPLTTLVNNAGVSVLSRGDLLDVTEASYDRCMQINAKAMFFMCQAFAKRRIDQQEIDRRFRSIINVTSANAGAVAVSRGEYCVSKAAAAMVAQVFAARLGRVDIAVYDIRPGLIETDMTRPVLDDYQKRIDEEELTLLPRLGTPEDIGRIATTLATGELPYTTGQIIAADAGMLVSRF